MALLIRAQDGSEEEIAPADRREGFSLAELYVLIGCDAIEVVALGDGRMMVLDEEAKIRNGPRIVNQKACALFWEGGGALWDVIVGNALICWPGELT